MPKDNMIKLIQPGNVKGLLTEILRNGARSLLAQAIEAGGCEPSLQTRRFEFRGRGVVRHGHLLTSEVMTGIGSVAPSANRKCALPRRTPQIETLCPVLSVDPAPLHASHRP